MKNNINQRFEPLTGEGIERYGGTNANRIFPLQGLVRLFLILSMS